MTITSNDLYKFREILEQKVAQAAQVPRRRTDIAIERSPDQMDEVQYAADRELAIQNLDRESGLLRDLRAALRRIHDGTFGSCVQCESAISSKRLAAVPRASRCIQCQEAADGTEHEQTESPVAFLVHAA
jgi:DnaK suppressor protein